MFVTLLSKEVRQHLLTFRFAAALLTTFVLIVVSVWILADDYLRRLDAFNRAEEETAQQQAGVYVPAQIKPVVNRPPSPLSIFAQGEDRRFGNTVKLERREVPRDAAGSFVDNPMMAAQPSFDLLTVFAVVISLFGILLSFDQISGERENGTLKMMAIGSTNRGVMFISKLLAGVVCLALPFLLSFVCSLIILTFIFGITFSAVRWLAIALMVVAGLVYGALFIALGLSCSALARRSSTALILTLLIWTLGVIVIPGAAPIVAAALQPLEPVTSVETLEKATYDEVWAELMAYIREHPEATGGWDSGRWPTGEYHLFDGYEIEFIGWANMIRLIEPRWFVRAERVWDEYRKHESKMREQAILAGTITSVAPVYHLQQAFTLLSATGVSGYEDFMEDARRCRKSFIDEFSARGYFSDNALGFFTRRDPEEINDALYEQRVAEFRAARERGETPHLGLSSWGPLPQEYYPKLNPQIPQPDLAGASWPIAILIVTAVIIMAVGFVAFIRYDVR